ncbi:MAG: hypothetical protein R2734_19645 [Nocardioides sp.]
MKRGVRLVTDGTDNHLVLLDVSSFDITGRQAESACWTARAWSPTATHGARRPERRVVHLGIRIGTPALTTRGFGHDEFDRVAELMVEVLAHTEPGTTGAGAPSKANYTWPTESPTECGPPRPSCSTPTRSTRASTWAEGRPSGKPGPPGIGSRRHVH